MSETLCWFCANYATCDWGRYNFDKKELNFQPIEGWVAKKTHREYGESYHVIECPEYKPDRKHIEKQKRKTVIPYWRSDEVSETARKAVEERSDELIGLSCNWRRYKIKEIYRDAGFCGCGRDRAEGHTVCQKCYEQCRKSRIEYAAKKKLLTNEL